MYDRLAMICVVRPSCDPTYCIYIHNTYIRTQVMLQQNDDMHVYIGIIERERERERERETETEYINTYRLDLEYFIFR